MNKSNTPRIRFKGFNEEWEKKRLGEEIANIVGGGTPSTSNALYWNGNIDWYSPSEVGKEVYVNGSEKKITALGLEQSSAKILPADKTVLFTSRASIGDMAILKHDGATNQGFQSLVIKEGYHIYFIYSAGHLFKQYVKQNASGSTFLEISGKKLGKLEINTPIETEQTQIGDFFKNLDSLISQKQSKYDKLVNIKKALLEKMFPKEGSSIPEVRFKDFSGEWEKKTLGEIFDFQYGYFNNNPSNDGLYPVYGANGIIGSYSEYNAENSVVIGHMGEYAGCIIWGEGKHFVTYNGIISTSKHSNISATYTYYLLCQLNIRKMCIGSGQPFLSYDMLKKVACVVVDDFAEQTQIGLFFQNLDKLLSLRKDEIEKLKNIKKAFLEKMFV